MNNSLKKGSQSGRCCRCGAAFDHRNARRAVKCTKCQRIFHTKCFLAETGLSAAVDSHCVVCLCGISQTPYPLTIQQNTLARKFLRDGFVVVPLTRKPKSKQTTLEKLATFRANAERYFGAFIRAYENELEISSKAPSLQSGYSNFRERGKGRYEVIFPSIREEVLSIIENCDEVTMTLDLLLAPTGKRGDMQRKLMSCGCFYSLPGSLRQDVHTDGPALSTVEDLFPYAINVFVPLVPLNKTNGTEFFPGSHRVNYSSKPVSQQRPVTPTVPLGKVLLFDYRVLHRGLGNRLGFHRPCYYATYARSWYEDKFNFSSTRYRTALHVPSYLLERRCDREVSKRCKVE
ncbi:phytanoyl-CoA dioxygenase (PhyH), putative [Trypanosoma equiperdum]|uniref:ADP-ribosylation factor-like protein 3A n=4 Tax=Trypanozoon TaxID=39700 RepID=Q57XJ4_TRYB2|nr:hypothetical protein, conserved [Trypanosoma brucei gambiense DAL972]XP_843936.1 hypothetical protein, conserved [Trypanosoma brucei brucei TREU927]AAX69674.1 hypothetical protein, conserved [Trypanosoma brucei]RHW73505.1 phytanoyl-CoA dioxygenase (PhyH) [Trypanosoma brucei equiperdum]SCU66044.1 phytanoyl-CoA dioxygenase (PhyH), putative [Trypanosoma equiperdum]AAZ10377.1 hypothetical protein, conserved [Trypanosoma brucei brucei TREU927]CBH10027.1 hypothetical protein, conserved [Trypanos|eukprot:XP_011772317.1 hypothetical protein, conserved [Trypanosoma brucei gambiense DAL972]